MDAQLFRFILFYRIHFVLSSAAFLEIIGNLEYRSIYFFLLLLSPCLSALDELSVLHVLCLFLFLYVCLPSFPLYSIALP